MLRVVIASFGEPRDPRTQSGVPNALVEALEARDDIVIAATVSTRPSPVVQTAIALTSLRGSLDVWRHSFHNSPLMRAAASRVRDRRLSDRPDFDVLLQVRGTYRPAPFPYVPYIDNAMGLVAREWSAWTPNRRLVRNRIRAERRYLSQAVHVLVTSDHLRDYLLSEEYLPDGRVSVVPGGTHDLPIVEVDPLNRLERPNILFVGRDPWRKGLDLLVDAFRDVKRRFPSASLTVVGCRANLPTDIEGIRVMGPVYDRETLAALYRSASVFCLPARYEPYGLVLQEAMSMGVPCVATDVGAIPSILDHGRCGVIVAPEDARELTVGITQLLNDADRADGLATAGRERAERVLTWAHAAERVVESLTVNT